MQSRKHVYDACFAAIFHSLVQNSGWRAHVLTEATIVGLSEIVPPVKQITPDIVAIGLSYGIMKQFEIADEWTTLPIEDKWNKALPMDLITTLSNERLNKDQRWNIIYDWAKRLMIANGLFGTHMKAPEEEDNWTLHFFTFFIWALFLLLAGCLYHLLKNWSH